MKTCDYMPWQYVNCLTVSIGEVTPNYSHRFLCAESPHSQHWTGDRIFTVKEITQLAATTSVSPDYKVTVVQLQFHCQPSTFLGVRTLLISDLKSLPRSKKFVFFWKEIQAQQFKTRIENQVHNVLPCSKGQAGQIH